MDFISSYGIAIVIIVAAFLVVYKIAFYAPISPFCSSPPGFSCDFASLNASGILTLKISQATGTQITINGAACADQQAQDSDTPLYGNIHVNGNTLFYYASKYYPPGNTIYSGGSYILDMYCYKSWAAAAGSAGSQFSGYVWLNYSIPNYGNQVEKIATFRAVYTPSPA